MVTSGLSYKWRTILLSVTITGIIISSLIINTNPKRISSIKMPDTRRTVWINNERRKNALCLWNLAVCTDNINQKRIEKCGIFYLTIFTKVNAHWNHPLLCVFFWSYYINHDWWSPAILDVTFIAYCVI